MKTTPLKRSMGFLAALVTATAAFRSSADEDRTAPKPEKTHTGTVISVDSQEHTLNVQGWLKSQKEFNLGNTCTFTTLDKPSSTVNDLRPGEKVEVSYQTVHGVRIADHVQQLAMEFEGRITAIDPANHQLTLHHGVSDKRLQIADECQVVLIHQRSGVVRDIRPGDHVTVTYETPDGVATAREIAQTSLEFAGNLTAIDLGERTVKAASGFDSKKFSVADHCAIVINGRADGHLSDLKPNDKLTFSYDEINGINVVNRIGVLESPSKAMVYNPATPY